MQADAFVQELVEHGPYLVDAGTGEIVGLRRDTDRREPWHITSRDDFEWVLSLRFAHEEKLVGLRTRLRNLQAQVDAELRAVGWWELRFKNELEQLTKDWLDGEKSRSIQSRDGYGRVGLRKTQGSIGVKDQAAAVQWAREHAPDAVKQPDPVVLVTPLKGREAELPADVFTVTPPEDKFFVDVQVKS